MPRSERLAETSCTEDGNSSHLAPTLVRHVTKLLALILASVSFAGSSGPISTSRPTIGGALRVGERLSAKPGSWTGRGTIRYAYQWSRCDANGCALQLDSRRDSRQLLAGGR